MSFGAIHELRDKIAAVDQHVLINTILKRPEFQKFIVHRNTDIQLLELNIDSEGVKLSANRSGYADLTLQIAEDEGRPKKGRDRVDLHATGEYHESHEVLIEDLKNDYFEMMSDAQKDETDLIEEWGPVLGLTEESMNLLAEKLIEPFLILFLEVIE